MAKIAFNFLWGSLRCHFFATNLTIHVVKNATNLTMQYAIFATFRFCKENNRLENLLFFLFLEIFILIFNCEQ